MSRVELARGLRAVSIVDVVVVVAISVVVVVIMVVKMAAATMVMMETVCGSLHIASNALSTPTFKYNSPVPLPPCNSVTTARSAFG